mmetsp:Transcript_10216/g.26332  ORF Transcript_10216/g.26332 Transcript_10216/m.26332 type:complete len:335 (+) Transcript_10216:49-1053(+)
MASIGVLRARHARVALLLLASVSVWLRGKSWCIHRGHSALFRAGLVLAEGACSANCFASGEGQFRTRRLQHPRSLGHDASHCASWRPRSIRTNLAAAPEPGAADKVRTLAPFLVPEPFGPLFESRPEDGGDSVVIWLHSGGGNGAFALYTVGAELRQGLPSTSFLFPTGPLRLPFPRWVNFGYDEVNVALDNTSSLVDFGGLEGMDESVKYVHALIEYELARGIQPGRVFLAGFSQGGALALEAGLASRARIGGIFGLSTFLLGSVPTGAQVVPVHLFHGDADPVVPLAWAEHTRTVLESAGVAASLRVYPGLWHSRCAEENADVVSVLRDSLH